MLYCNPLCGGIFYEDDEENFVSGYDKYLHNGVITRRDEIYVVSI